MLRRCSSFRKGLRRWGKRWGRSFLLAIEISARGPAYEGAERPTPHQLMAFITSPVYVQRGIGASGRVSGRDSYMQPCATASVPKNNRSRSSPVKSRDNGFCPSEATCYGKYVSTLEPKEVSNTWYLTAVGCVLCSVALQKSLRTSCKSEYRTPGAR